MMAATWDTLERKLEEFAELGQTISFWLRDDDAIFPTPAFDRFLTLVECHGIPAALAVIPQETGNSLARALEAHEDIAVLVHGWSHDNFAPSQEKKQELGNHRPLDVMVDEVTAGLRKLQTLYAPNRLQPVLVPPWNRISPALVGQLAGVGYKGLSTFGLAKTDMPRLLAVNTHVDIMDWHGTGGGRHDSAVLQDLLAQIEIRRSGNPEPIGILTHHLVHDEQAWMLLEKLLSLTSRHPRVTWRSISQLMS